MDCNHWVCLQVGNKSFQTTLETLLKIPYFDSMIHFNADSFTNIIKKNNINNPIKIDRNGSVFKHLLNHVHNPNYQIPKKHQWDLDFWGYYADGCSRYDKFWANFSSTIDKNTDLDLDAVGNFGFYSSSLEFGFHQQDPFVLSKEQPTKVWNLKSTKHRILWYFGIITDIHAPRDLINVKFLMDGKQISNCVIDIGGKKYKKRFLNDYLYLNNSIISDFERNETDHNQTIEVSLLNPSEVVKPIKAILIYRVQIEPAIPNYWSQNFNATTETRFEFNHTDNISLINLVKVSELILIIYWKTSSFVDHVSLGSNDNIITFSFDDIRFENSPKHSKKWQKLDFRKNPLRVSASHFIKFPKVLDHILVYVTSV